MNIDLATIALILVISSIFQAVFILLLASKYPGVDHFGVSCSFYALGFLFVMLQGSNAYDLITVVIGNALLLLALIFQYIGLVRFLELPENRWFPPLVFGFCLLALIYFQFVFNSISIRIFSINLAIGLIALLIARTLTQKNSAPLPRQTQLLLLLFVATGIFAVVKAIHGLFSPPIDSALSPSLFQIISFTGAFIASIIVTFTFIVMINERMSSDIRSAKEQFEQIFNLSPDASLITTLPDGTIVNFNLGFLNFSGFSREEVLNKSLLELNLYVNPADREKLLNEIAANQSVDDFELKFRNKNNDIRICSVSAKFITLNTTPHVISIIHDITDRKRDEEAVLYLSYHDQLTGLYNRRFYEEELLRLDTPRNLPIALLMADVNGLKLINDAYGHQVGDKILKEFAEILKNECRHDEIASRVGGDEFVILFSHTDQQSLESIVKRLNAAISNVRIDHTILSVSMGFALKENPMDDLNDVFKRAEDAMYQHKLTISPSIKRATIDLIVKSIYERNHLEVLHSQTVSEYCQAIARVLGFETEAINQLGLAGLRHDIGEIAIDEAILTKSEQLSDAEWAEIKRHPEIGYHILRSVNELAEIAKFVLEHHERWDGRGYPKGLKADEISLQGRIIAIADAYCTMTTERPYCRAFTDDEAINEIQKCSGLQFDENLARLFVEKVLHKEWPQS
ncbi:MAG: HD domain-containing phosphohydrolase [Acetobacterium sp.]|uniref:HD domain-containing phosphohydrolase n=1 Tax=Acetobacterium sp. TaxID=1872094 RepID=UPI0032424C32